MSWACLRQRSHTQGVHRREETNDEFLPDPGWLSSRTRRATDRYKILLARTCLHHRKGLLFCSTHLANTDTGTPPTLTISLKVMQSPIRSSMLNIMNDSPKLDNVMESNKRAHGAASIERK